MEECNSWIDNESPWPHLFWIKLVDEGFNSWKTHECKCQDQAEQP